MTAEKWILLVEDQPDDAALALRAFQKTGLLHTVHVAPDGVTALDCLFGEGGTPPGLPALVLLDLKLPKLDGFEVLRRIREEPRTRLLPVVVLTSSNERSDVVTGYGLGANSYVRKPVDFGAFLEIARLLREYWLTLNELPPA